MFIHFLFKTHLPSLYLSEICIRKPSEMICLHVCERLYVSVSHSLLLLFHDAAVDDGLWFRLCFLFVTATTDAGGEAGGYVVSVRLHHCLINHDED